MFPTSSFPSLNRLQKLTTGYYPLSILLIKVAIWKTITISVQEYRQNVQNFTTYINITFYSVHSKYHERAISPYKQILTNKDMFPCF